MTLTSGKIFAIGDIHGSYHKLRGLLDRLPYTPGRDRLVFLGDYLDRGPDSARVLDLLCELKGREPDTIALLGNHEYLLLEYYRSGDPILLPYLRGMGLDATLDSYGPRSTTNLQTLSFLPQEHLAFLLSLLPYWESPYYIFVHAGLEPNIPLAANDLPTLCEARDTFIALDHDFGKKVIFGHTPFELPYVTATKIGIDTGAMYDNLLTAIQLPDEMFFHA
jgi:serine/threonine protein phosphatase 1